MKTIIGILIAIILLGSLYARRELNKYRGLSQLQAVELAQLQDSVQTYQTKNGQLISKFEAVEVDKRNLKEALELSGVQIKDLKDQDIKWRNLVNILQLKIKSLGEGQTTVVDTFYIVENTTDTVYYQKIGDWTDSYLSLYNARVENKEFKFKYDYNVDLDLFSEKKRNSIIVTANLNNPNASISTANSITLSTRKKWYEKPWIWGVAGVGTGILISK